MKSLASHLIGSAMLLAVIGCAQSASVEEHDATLTRTPYLQTATPHSIWIVWRTAGKIEPVVRFGTDPAHLDQTSDAKAIVVRIGTGTKEIAGLPPGIPRLFNAPPGTHRSEAQLTGLEPKTRYYYAVYDGDHRLTENDDSYYFVTHPLPGTEQPMRFWVVGDSGTGKELQANVHTAMLNLTAAEHHPIDFFLHVGDMAYSRGKDREFQKHFFEMYQPTLRHIVCWPAMGNHEGYTSKGTNGVGPYYDAYVVPTKAEAGGVPSGMEAYYSFDYGNAHFICLDSHDLDRSPSGAMARWLKADLEKVRADWLIAFWHHPPYTKGSHDSDTERQLVEMRKYIMPMLESAGVDLVLTGHSHIYERSMLMDGAYATPTVAENVILNDGDGDPHGDGAYQKSAGIHPHEGDIQIVAGHGGATLKRKGTMPVMRKIIVEHGSVIMDIDGDTLSGLMLNRKGEIRDRFALVKRGKITPTRIAHPWQPPVWIAPKSADEPGSEEPPKDFVVIIPPHDSWAYLAGENPPAAWTAPDFQPPDWKSGRASFGYSDRPHETTLTDMRSRYRTVYLRKEFDMDRADNIDEIGLMMDYDDAFIAYLNGKEVLRVGVGHGRGNTASQIKDHESKGGYSYFPLHNYENVLHDGRNVLAIEGHNVNLNSSDFTLDPYLIIEH